MKANEAIKIVDYRDHVIKIFQDDDYNMDMLNDDENVFLLYYHRQFFITRNGFAEPRTKDTIDEWKVNYHIFTVYAYIHSGVSLSLSNDNYPFNDQWDVSNCGFVMVKKDSGIEKPLDAAQSLIDEYNNILSGNVFGYVIEFNNQTDSCWGYIGDIDKSGIIEEAKAVIDGNIERNANKYAKQLKLDL
jgi:hypothetical protein